MRITPTRGWLGILIAVAFALRLIYCAATTGLGQSSPEGKYYREYIMAGGALVEHGTLISPLIIDNTSTAPSSLMPPAYAGLVAVAYRLMGTETFAATLVLQVINAAATSLTVLFVFLIARQLGSPLAAWLAALIATINPTLFGFTPYTWDTSLFCLGVILCVWVSMSLSRRVVGWRGWLAFGLLLGGLALLNPALTVAYPLLVLWPLTKLHGWRLGPMLRPIAMSVCGWLIAITPWTVRNYVQFGELMYIRSGFRLQLWLGVCPEADAHGAAVFGEQFPLLNEEVQRTVASVGERKYLEDCGQRAIAAISGDPWRFVRLCAIRTIDYWAGTVFSHARPGGGGWPRSKLRLAVTLFLLVEVLLAATFILIRPNTGPDVRWLLAIILSFSIVYCLTHLQIRFRAPSEPIMAIVVAVLLTNTIGAWRARRHRRAQTEVGGHGRENAM